MLMKVKILAVIMLIFCTAATLINTYMLLHQIDRISATIENSDTDSEETMRELFFDFKRREVFLSLTVDHDDLSVIEELFAETVGCLSSGDADGARVAKSRLIDALSHLRRLSGINISSIF